MRVCYGLLMLVLLTGCGRTVDNSSDEALQESLGEMLAERTPKEQQQLADALIVIALDETAYSGQPPRDVKAIAADATLAPALRRALDGEDFDELLQRADELRSVRAEQTIEHARAAQVELREKLAAAREESKALSGISVRNPRYHWTTGDFMPQAVIEFELANLSAQPITGVKLRGQLSSPERDVPWVRAVLNHELLRPQSAKTSERYRLVPNQGSEWGNRQLQSRKDMRISFTVINARVGDRWLVSEDMELLEQQLKQLEANELQARALLAEIRARQPR